MNKGDELVVRAFILSPRGLLLCRTIGADWFFLPGGHIEFQEKAASGLARELEEELGVQVQIGNLLGAVENAYIEEGIHHHEINFIFRVKLESEFTGSREPHIEFVFVDLKKVSEVNLLPVSVKEFILELLSKGVQFGG